jgi:hypothetical protein
MFFHYYFRSIRLQSDRVGSHKDSASLFLDEDEQWLEKYTARSLKRKRVEVFLKMTDAQTLGA